MKADRTPPQDLEYEANDAAGLHDVKLCMPVETFLFVTSGVHTKASMNRRNEKKSASYGFRKF
jgi:hypothetical protein